MPAFKAFLKPEEIDALVAYVRWIAAGDVADDGVATKERQTSAGG